MYISVAAAKMVSFFTAGRWEKDTIFGAARKNFDPSYFVTALAKNNPNTYILFQLKIYSFGFERLWFQWEGEEFVVQNRSFQ